MRLFMGTSLVISRTIMMTADAPREKNKENLRIAYPGDSSAIPRVFHISGNTV